MNYVYVIWDSESRKFYIGYTQNIDRRISEHKRDACHTTQRYAEKSLVYYEAFKCETDARRRERYLKSSNGRKGLKLILRESISR
jgi:putative endonuclease